MGINTEITYWLISCNVRLFDPFSAFDNMDEIDWPQSCKVKNDDVAFIYCTKPHMRIAFMTKVIRSSLPLEQAKYKGEIYYEIPEAIKRTPRYGYMRLELIKCSSNDNLSLKKLMSHGLTAAPQGPLRLHGTLLKYVREQF